MTRSVIVVGPDGVGKTTVVARISEITGIPSFKCPSEKEIFRKGGRESLGFDFMLTHFLRQTGHSFVSDRGYPCEWVYSEVFGRETDESLLRQIDRAHADLGTEILHLYSSIPPFVEDDIVPADRFRDVSRGYDRFCERSLCYVTSIDTAPMLLAYQSGRDLSEAFARHFLETVNLRGGGWS